MKILLLPMMLLIISCSEQKEESQFQKLLEYEGHYEYINNTTLDIIASEVDTLLYAVINKAKYPLTHNDLDNFTNVQDKAVVFNRNDTGEIDSYSSNGKTFKLISKDFEKLEMFPRKDLFHTPEKYSYQKPKKINDGITTGILEDEFNNPELIYEMIRETIRGNFSDVHSILIYKNDKLVLEEYFYGFDIQTPHQLRSATKPIIGGVLGIAIDQGLIENEQDKVLPYFKSKYKEIAHIDQRKEQLTIENLLMYRHGMDCQNNNAKSKGNEQAMMQSSDWIKYSLDLPMVNNPGTSSSYCTGAALIIGGLVEVVTNKKIEDFAEENLFSPMGIDNYEWTFEPKTTSKTSFNQMSLTSRGLLKLAKMYKDGGIWQGKQILSKRWVDKTFDMEEGDYGYLWEHKFFVINGKRYNSYLATGNGGQKVNIWPELNMITVFTGGNYNSYLLYGKSTPPNEMIPNYILKSL